MQQRSFFAEEIQWEGETWVRIFDPADPIGVVPDLRGGMLKKQTVAQVTLPNRDDTFFLLLMEIELPSSLTDGVSSPAKQIKGFRLYERRPEASDINFVRNSDLVYYLRKPAPVEQSGTAQEFLNAVLGSTIVAAERKAAAERAWSKTLFAGGADEQGAGAGRAQRTALSGHVSDGGDAPA